MLDSQTRGRQHPRSKGARLNEGGGERRGERTCASVAATACREENQQRAPGRSGQRSTTVCRVSGECSSTCLREEIRKLLTSPLSPDGCRDFYSAQPLMNKFLLNIENTLPALSGRASSTELNLNLWGFFFSSLRQNATISILIILALQLQRTLISVSSAWKSELRMIKSNALKCESIQISGRKKQKTKKTRQNKNENFRSVLGRLRDTMPSPTTFP